MPTALSPEQVRLVLRRAAELEKRPEHDVSGSGEDEVAEIAAEVGIAPEAVKNALAEMRAGLVKGEPEQVTFLDRLVGPEGVTHSRTVQGSLADVRREVTRFMQGQLMQIKRNLGERGQTWEPAPDLWSRVRRTFDITRKVVLDKGTEVTVQVIPTATEGQVLVRMTARLVEPRRSRAWKVAVGALGGVAIAGAGIAGFHTVGPEVVSILAGAGTAAGTLAAVRANHKRDLTTTEAALLRFLDALEHGEPEPAPAPPGVQRFLRWTL